MTAVINDRRSGVLIAQRVSQNAFAVCSLFGAWLLALFPKMAYCDTGVWPNDANTALLLCCVFFAVFGGVQQQTAIHSLLSVDRFMICWLRCRPWFQWFTVRFVQHILWAHYSQMAKATETNGLIVPTLRTNKTSMHSVLVCENLRSMSANALHVRPTMIERQRQRQWQPGNEAKKKPQDIDVRSSTSCRMNDINCVDSNLHRCARARAPAHAVPGQRRKIYYYYYFECKLLLEVLVDWLKRGVQSERINLHLSHWDLCRSALFAYEIIQCGACNRDWRPNTICTSYC